jgi:hypothetical protein
MKTKKYDDQRLGILVGVFSPLIGFFIYGALWAWHFAKPFNYFLNDVFLGIPSFRSSILTLSLVFNLVPFFIFVRTNRNKTARGVLLAVFLYIPLVVYYRFFS